MMLERPVHTWEGEIAPGNLLPGEEPCLQAFGAGRELTGCEAGAKNQLHLRDAWHRVDRQQAVDLDLGLRLLPCLARRAFGRRLPFFHVTGRDGPEARARLYRAAAQQNSSVPGANGA